MSSAFNRTMRSLEGDSYAPLIRLAVVGVLVLAAWIAWARLASMPVYVLSPAGRVEVSHLAIPVQSLDSGRVITSNVALGRTVAVGDVLVVLDSRIEEQRLAEQNERLASVEAKITSLRDQMSLYEQVLATQDRIVGAQADAVRIRTEAAASALERAENINDISRRLAEERLTSALQHLQNENDTLAQRDLLAVARSEAQQAQLSRELEARRADLQLADVRRQLGELEGERSVLRASIHALELEIERRTIRAPSAGVLGNVTPLQVGMVLSPGRPFATIVPESDLRIVATFPAAETIGRVAPGQKAFFRFDGFPWTQYGIPEGRVEQVANETLEGGIRVELSLSRTAARLIPMQHGLTASVEIEVEQASPWTMLLRSLGAMTRGAAAPAGPSASNQGDAQ